MKFKIVAGFIAGLLIMSIDAEPTKAGAALYHHDQLDRLVRIIHSDCSFTFFEYDEIGSKTAAYRRMPPDPGSFEITGPVEVDENTTAHYALQAGFRNAGIIKLDGLGVWRDSSHYTEMSASENGGLIVGSVESDKIIKITVTYDICGATRTRSVELRLKDTDSGGGETCNGYPYRLVRDFSIIGCYNAISSAYASAVEGDVIQASNAGEDGIELTCGNPKKVILEGYEGNIFEIASGVTSDSLVLRAGTLVIR